MILRSVLIILPLLVFANHSGPVTIKSKWDMPEVLREISGIAYLEKGKFACIQDEAGTIYFYNTTNNKIERELVFTGPGDFEGICLVQDTAWIIRSDGRLFEVKNLHKEPAIQQYTSGLAVRLDIEGICYDKLGNRLLIAVKEAPRGDQTYKAIYSFDLAQKKIDPQPAIRINIQDEMFSNSQQKKGTNFLPSDINIHPLTGELYITDGYSSRLLIMERTGKLKRLLSLPGKEFSQPEGICFDPGGNIYISNEGIKLPGNILHIGLSD